MGRMSSIAAPVVPIQLASTVPIKRMAVFTIGDPRREPLRQIPPAAVKSAASNMINGT